MTGKTDFLDLLDRVKSGDRAAANELATDVMEDLRRIAHGLMFRERANHTQPATAVAGEACLRLLAEKNLPAESRAHFLALAARNMRQYLIAYARQRRAEKRGGDAVRVEFDDSIAMTQGEAVELIDLDQALRALQPAHPRQAQVVEMHFFAGATTEDIGQALGVASRTVKRDLDMAKTFLRIQLGSREFLR